MQQFFFLHIPKTAGTSFRHMLAEEFPRRRSFPTQREIRLNQGVYPAEDTLVQTAPRRRRQARLLVGHYSFYAGEKFFGAGGNLNYLTFVRDPIERAVSNLWHIRRNSKTLKDAEPEVIFAQSQRAMCNAQVRYLAGPEHLPAPSDLAIAQHNLREFSFIGVAERFADSLTLANRRYGWNLGSPIRINTAPETQSVSDDLLAQLAKANELDQQLYEYALELFEARLAAVSQTP